MTIREIIEKFKMNPGMKRFDMIVTYDDCDYSITAYVVAPHFTESRITLRIDVKQMIVKQKD